jgi:fluoroacetyl-CoA thioesterase
MSPIRLGRDPMKDTLKVGDKARLEYKIPADKTVPNLYPEALEFQLMPTVFATGFMVGLMEWTCLKVLEPHIDSGEGSLGIHINVSHVAATVPGQTVAVDAECISISGRRIGFRVKAHDGVEVIGEGTHERMIVPWERFVARVNEKAKLAHAALIQRVGSGVVGS